MSFRNDTQRGQVAQALTDRLRKGDFWKADAHDCPRPTSALRGHLARVFTSSEAQLVRLAWDVWNGGGKSNLGIALATLDTSNLRMVGELLTAIAAPNPSPISDWCLRWGLGAPEDPETPVARVARLVAEGRAAGAQANDEARPRPSATAAALAATAAAIDALPRCPTERCAGNAFHIGPCRTTTGRALTDGRW